MNTKLKMTKSQEKMMNVGIGLMFLGSIMGLVGLGLTILLILAIVVIIL